MGLESLTTMLSAILPEKAIIEKLDNALSEYKLDSTDEKRKMLELTCILFLEKGAIEKEGLKKVVETQDQVKRIHDSLTTKTS